MPRTLGEIERRVTGALLEKLLATPAYYPLTVNALTAACNQRNNRDPVMDLPEEAVFRALHALREQGLAVHVQSEGARAEKWKTTAHEAFGLGDNQQAALLAELLLRGPQTKAELRAHASRMKEVTAEDLDRILADFAGRPEPLVASLGRAPGGRAERWAHALYSEEEMAALKAGPVPSFDASRASPAPRSGCTGPPAAAADPDLAGKVERALAEIAALRERVEALERAAGARAAAPAPAPRPPPAPPPAPEPSSSL